MIKASFSSFEKSSLVISSTLSLDAQCVLLESERAVLMFDACITLNRCKIDLKGFLILRKC